MMYAPQTKRIAAAICIALVSDVARCAVPKVITYVVPSGGDAIAAKCDSHGVIHLVVNSSEGPRYVKSQDEGKSFSEPIAIVGPEAQTPGLTYDVWDMAVGREERIHVAMGTNAWKLKLPKEEWGLFYARLEPGAKAFTRVRNINHQPSEGFSLAANENGEVTACWLSGKLYGSVSHDNGKTFSEPIEIDPAIDPCDCCTTSAAYGEDGKLAVLYREETNNERDMFVVTWDQKRNKSKRTRISSTLWKIESCPMTYFTLTRTKNGFDAVWPTKGQIYFAKLDGQGEILPRGEIETAGRTGMRSGVLALSNNDGMTLVVWRELGELRWQLFDEKGFTSGATGSAKSSGSGVAAVVDRHGDFVLIR